VGDLLTIDEALAAVLERARPLGAEDVPLNEAVGRFLALSAEAAVDLPPFASSAMDGFAVRSADLPGRLAIVGRIAAGRPISLRLEPGQAMGIATGGVVPAGADAVVPIEHVVETADMVEILSAVPPDTNVRGVGGDVRRGESLLPAGVRLGPAQVAALAAAGIPAVSCGVRPMVTVLTTGTELRAPGAILGPGEIYESNGTMIEAALRGTGARVARLGPVADDDAAHRAALGEGLAGDVLVTTGGVSVGPHDLVRRLESELGVDEVFWGVAVRPGKPVSFGVRGRTLVFGLPGNPVSSLVAFELFVRPAILALQGALSPGPEYHAGVLAREVRANDRRAEFARARLVTSAVGAVLEPVTGQESHMIARAATADALVLVPQGAGLLPAGAAVRYLRLA
jgi:molybdopterin molybdotransferase